MTNPRRTNLIFDVGGVLFDYRWQDMLIGYGLDPDEAFYAGEAIFASPYWAVYDLGTEPDEVVLRGLQAHYPEYRDVIARFIREAAQMAVPRPAVWEKVHALHEAGYGIYLLSNYPERFYKLHTENVPFLNDVDGSVISFEVQMSKPDPRIFRRLFDTYSLDAADCVFYDDREINVRAAEALGVEAHLIDSEKQLLNLLDGLL